MKLSEYELSLLVDLGDPDGVVATLEDMGLDEEADEVRERYFNQ